MGILVGILGFLVVCLGVFSFIQCKKIARLEEENSDLCAEIEELDDENDSLFSSVECANNTVKMVNLFSSVLGAKLSYERSIISRFLKSDSKISESKAFLVVDGELHKVVDFDYKISENGKIIVNSLVLEPFTEKLAEPAIHGLYMAASSIDETVKKEKARVLEEEIQGKQKELEKLKK